MVQQAIACGQTHPSYSMPHLTRPLAGLSSYRNAEMTVDIFVLLLASLDAAVIVEDDLDSTSLAGENPASAAVKCSAPNISPHLLTAPRNSRGARTGTESRPAAVASEGRFPVGGYQDPGFLWQSRFLGAAEQLVVVPAFAAQQAQQERRLADLASRRGHDLQVSASCSFSPQLATSSTAGLRC